MSLDAVRTRRHIVLLAKIADERARKDRRSRQVQRVKTTRTIVSRDSDDTTGGSPATIVRIVGTPQFPIGNYYEAQGPTFTQPYRRIEKIVHKSGPIIAAESFGAADVGPDGSIVLQRISETDT